jgi:TonB family protein
VSDAASDVTLRDFASGQKVFSRYTLDRTLGRGGMGIVWLAHDEVLDRQVALKFLPEIIIHDRAVLDDLKRETKRSLELTHKNIVRIYDFANDESSAAITMEYIDGDTLSNLRADRPNKVFETRELNGLMKQLCDALDYAHNHARVVHRDIKPSNLMLNRGGDLKVTDFGVARSLSDSVSMVSIGARRTSGTLVYMSPQQLDGERGSHLDDIYSVGATLYELLTSKPPFHSGNIDRQIHERVPPPMSHRREELEVQGEPIDETWEAVVAACLQKDPTRRPQSAIEVLNRLMVRPPSKAISRPKRIGKNPFRPIGVAILAVGQMLGRGAAAGVKLTRKVFRDAGHMCSDAGKSIYHSAATVFSVAKKILVQAVRLLVAVGRETLRGTAMVLIPAALVAICIWYFAIRLPPKKVVPQPLLQTESTKAPVDQTQSNQPRIAPPASTAGVSEMPTTSVGPQLAANAVYDGTIHVENDSSVNVPLLITIGSDLKSGTMTQTGQHGDAVAKFTGVWDGTTLRAATDELISSSKGIQWQPESFTLHFTNDGKRAIYQCLAGQKTYTADLSLRSMSVANVGSVYKGTIRQSGELDSGTPLTLTLAANRKSGTMTQTSKSGDTVVRFDGVWNGDLLRAVTNEVISKPTNVQWKPESFTLRFTEDGKSGSYECKSEGRIYSAELLPGALSHSEAKALAIFAPQPEYPAEARRHHITGNGVCMLTIDASGNVTDATMVQSIGSSILDNAALSAFRRWRFKPGTDSKIKIPINFTMTNASH